MPKAITNTSPLLYLYRIQAIGWLPKLFQEVWSPEEAKSQGLIDKIAPYVTHLSEAGMWVSIEIRQRILDLAGES